MKTPLIPILEAAQKCGVSKATFRRYCASGRVKGAIVIGERWLVPYDFIVDAEATPGAKRPLAINGTARGRRRVG